MRLNFLARNSLELINLVPQWKIIADFPQLIIHKPLCTIKTKSEMRKILTIILLLSTIFSFRQKMTTIKVLVPNKTDEVFIVGNQENLGNWQPDKVKMNRISDYEREISLNLSLPAEFKFTRGSWNNEGYTSNFWDENPNLKIIDNTQNTFTYKILSWKDLKQTSGSFDLSFKIQTNFSKIFNEDRTIAIKLPENYNPNRKYSVIYVLDANTLYKPFLLNTKLLSDKFVSGSGTDYGRDNIPEAIVVGVFHNDRGYETTPKFDYENDKNLFLEGSQKLKDYLFNELVPMINSQYSTSSYNCIVGHSNTGHFVLNLPFLKNNPFKGIIALSINADSDYFKNMIINYLKTEKENVFIGFGTMDDGFNELGELLNDEIKNKSIINPHLKVQSFEATHNQLPALSASAGIKFLFNNYKNFTSFIEESTKPNFSVSEYLKNYKNENEKYGIDINISGDDLFTIAEMTVEHKNIKLFREVVEYSNQHKDKIQNHLIFWLSTEIKDYETADKIINILLQTKNEDDIFLTIANSNQYLEYLVDFKKSPKSAQLLFKNVYENSPDYKLESAYFIAKVGLENKVNIKESKKYLRYCKKHYKENRIFNETDLQKLEKK